MAVFLFFWSDVVGVLLNLSGCAHSYLLDRSLIRRSGIGLRLLQGWSPVAVPEQSTVAFSVEIFVLEWVDEVFERLNSKIILDGVVADIARSVDNCP